MNIRRIGSLLFMVSAASLMKKVSISSTNLKNKLILSKLHQERPQLKVKNLVVKLRMYTSRKHLLQIKKRRDQSLICINFYIISSQKQMKKKESLVKIQMMKMRKASER
jgi:hypothetical protein